jgi:heparan-alpha-glucosaminide N-acetyltransferase
MTKTALDSAMHPDAGAETLSNPPPAPPERLASIDAYRGLVMFLMMAEALKLCQVASRMPGDRFWELLCHHQSHVEWVGCSLHDLIQPSFSFLVGVALPYSVAGRLARGQSKIKITAHALWRSLVLVFLGVFLRSLNSSQTNFTFEDTLSQIGLGYTFLFVLALYSRRVQWAALVLILIGYWGAFALYRLPGPEFDFSAVGVPPDWSHHPAGFAKHWDKNSNLAWAFDTWFLNLFPREKPFTHNGGGYATLSFIPTLATMILGLLAGGVLRRTGSGWARVRWLAVAACTGLVAGSGLGELGLCPVVKRIWTPSWVLYSGGWCFLFLAVFFAVLDVVKVRFWAFPLRVIGMNSIAAYCMADVCRPFISQNLTTHLGTKLFTVAGHAFEPLLRGAGVLLVLWLILFWMYRRKLFLRI